MEEKQIEKLKNDITECYGCDPMYYGTDGDFLARGLVGMGWRKHKEGEWQTAPDGTHWCSECGHDATYTYDGTEICGVACPFCGAHMKGGAE